MGRGRTQHDLVGVVEACYRDDGDDASWLSELFRSAAPVLDRGLGLGLSLVREPPGMRRVVLSRGTGPLHRVLEASWPVIQQLDHETYRRFFYPRTPVVLASSLVAEFSPALRGLFRVLLSQGGAQDLFGMLAYPAPGWSSAMFIALGEQPLDPPLRASLRRLRIHLETSMRLRMFSSGGAVAVLYPDGRLAHVEKGVSAKSSHQALGAQVSIIERARSMASRADPHRALATWQALVHGRWSVVEREDTDGKRFYQAFENAPHTRFERALTETENAVLKHYLEGLTGKEVAYATGLSAARVSSALASAAERLGFTSRAEILRVASVLREGSALRLPQLTPAEQGVMELVCRGLSNREIAVWRGTSTNTVAVQIASLLRKTGEKNRRGLARAFAAAVRAQAPQRSPPRKRAATRFRK